MTSAVTCMVHACVSVIHNAVHMADGAVAAQRLCTGCFHALKRLEKINI